MIYKELNIEQAERIREIDGECYIHKAWRDINGKRELVVVDWTDNELPNGLSWHIENFQKSLLNGGRAIGCFNGDILIGYLVMNSNLFGNSSKYI